MNSNLRRFLFVTAIFTAPFSTQLVACTGQGEGERCERKNGNDDCQDGLVCKSSKDLGGNADICCPNGDSSAAECKLSVGTTSTGTDMSTSTATGAGGGTTSSASSSSASSTASSTASSSSGTGGAGGGSSSAAGGG